MDHHHWRRSSESKYAAVRAALLSAETPAKQPDALNELLSGTGCEELIGPIHLALMRIAETIPPPPKNQWRAVIEAIHKVANCFIKEPIPTPEDVVNIPTDRIFSCEWAPYRTMNFFMTLARKGTFPGPATVSAISVFGETYYTVTNGNHRNEAFKTMGRKHIPAVIDGYSKATPSEWVIGKEKAVHTTTKRQVKLSLDQCAALIWLGANPTRSTPD